MMGLEPTFSTPLQITVSKTELVTSLSLVASTGFEPVCATKKQKLHESPAIDHSAMTRFINNII